MTPIKTAFSIANKIYQYVLSPAINTTAGISDFRAFLRIRVVTLPLTAGRKETAPVLRGRGVKNNTN
jgi:hypothetical protein